MSKYLEGYRNQVVAENDALVPVRREMRIKDLLNMTSGLLYPQEGAAGMAVAEVFNEIHEKSCTENALTTIEIANRLGECPLAFHPGENWAYGTSADVLAAVIEVVAGVKFGDFLNKEIFEPLGMKDRHFTSGRKKRPLPKPI